MIIPLGLSAGVLVAASLSFAIGALSKTFGTRLGVVDAPDDGLKIHWTPAVPLGGVGVIIGIHIGLLIADLVQTGFLYASLVIWMVGLIDDIGSLPPVTRLVAAVVSGLLLVGLGDLTQGSLAGVAAVLVVVASVNAVNLLDGLDALAGSVATTALLALAILAAARDESSTTATALIAAASVVGFLFWNLPMAHLFLGNNGAYLIGLTLAWIALRLGATWEVGVVAVAVIGIPFLDLGIAVVRRMKSRAALFSGDRDHTYDRLHQRGWSPGKIAFWFSVAQALWSILVVAVAIQIGYPTAGITALILGLAVILIVGLRGSSPISTSS